MTWERCDGKKPGEEIAECPCCADAAVEIERLRAALETIQPVLHEAIQAADGPEQMAGVLQLVNVVDAALGHQQQPPSPPQGQKG